MRSSCPPLPPPPPPPPPQKTPQQQQQQNKTTNKQTNKTKYKKQQNNNNNKETPQSYATGQCPTRTGPCVLCICRIGDVISGEAVLGSCIKCLRDPLRTLTNTVKSSSARRWQPREWQRMPLKIVRSLFTADGRKRVYR